MADEVEEVGVRAVLVGIAVEDVLAGWCEVVGQCAGSEPVAVEALAVEGCPLHHGELLDVVPELVEHVGFLGRERGRVDMRRAQFVVVKADDTDGADVAEAGMEAAYRYRCLIVVEVRLAFEKGIQLTLIAALLGLAERVHGQRAGLYVPGDDHLLGFRLSTSWTRCVSFSMTSS